VRQSKLPAVYAPAFKGFHVFPSHLFVRFPVGKKRLRAMSDEFSGRVTEYGLHRRVAGQDRAGFWICGDDSVLETVQRSL